MSAERKPTKVCLCICWSCKMGNHDCKSKDCSRTVGERSEVVSQKFVPDFSHCRRCGKADNLHTSAGYCPEVESVDGGARPDPIAETDFLLWRRKLTEANTWLKNNNIENTTVRQFFDMEDVYSRSQTLEYLLAKYHEDELARVATDGGARPDRLIKPEFVTDVEFVRLQLDAMIAIVEELHPECGKCGGCKICNKRVIAKHTSDHFKGGATDGGARELEQAAQGASEMLETFAQDVRLFTHQRQTALDCAKALRAAVDRRKR
jgi:hypothetical protein